MKKNLSLIMAALALAGTAFGQSTDWPVVNQEAKPGTRWWWLGSSVDSHNLTYNLETYAKAGIGAVEITPIYGAQNNEKNEIDFLSDRWMRMLSHTEAEGKRLGIQVDMNTGTGWPFGGPEVSLEEAASCAVFHTWKTGEQQPELSEKDLKNGAKLAGVWSYPIPETRHMEGKGRKAHEVCDSMYVALYNSHTRQAVKRAAPGGIGYVMDHLNPEAVKHYLNRFTEAFNRTQTAVPHTFFNDSYEVYGADWSPSLLDEFEKRRGYRLQDHLPAFLDEKAPDHQRFVVDYRETMGDMVLDNFTHLWAAWAHQMGSTVRNQAHGSPANLLDVYAAVDIPEIEGFGLSDFGIKGLRTDSMWKKNDSDLSMLKYAASAAHVMGKPYTSSETFTWLTEHFRTSLSQCKPDFDLMQIAGVNHCYFHGTTYSPKTVFDGETAEGDQRTTEWPGHLFYASMEMSPINTIWQDAPDFFQYMTRVQSFMQYGKPDNDLLVYMPIYDIWNDNGGRLLMLAIHGMEKKSPKFVNAVIQLYDAGYDMDYISDKMIKNCHVKGDRIVTEGGTSYKALVLPEVRYMQPETMLHLVKLANDGGTIVIVGGYPENVPGYNNYKERTDQLADAVAQFPTILGDEASAVKMGKGRIATAKNYKAAMALVKDIKSEGMKADQGLKCIRRSNETGYHYFISCLQAKDVDADVILATPAKGAILFDPMTGRKGLLPVTNENGVCKVHLKLASGESCILQTYSDISSEDLAAKDPSLSYWTYRHEAAEAAIPMKHLPWTLDVSQLKGHKVQQGSKPLILPDLMAWSSLSGLQTAIGTATYSTTLKLSGKQLKKYSSWMLDLGDVRESARVFVNGQEVGTLFAVPFRIDVAPYLKAGKNEISIQVTSLAANYLAQMDRDGKQWRKFKDANIAVLPGYDKDPKNKTYANWGTIPCGLNGEVKLVPME